MNRFIFLVCFLLIALDALAIAEEPESTTVIDIVPTQPVNKTENIATSFDLIVKSAQLTRQGVRSLGVYRPNLYVALYLNDIYQSETETRSGYHKPIFRDARFTIENVDKDDRISLEIIHREGPVTSSTRDRSGSIVAGKDIPIKVLGSADMKVSSVMQGDLRGKVTSLDVILIDTQDTRAAIMDVQVTRYRQYSSQSDPQNSKEVECRCDDE